MGRAVAIEVAAQVAGVVLLARNAERLRDTAAAVRRAAPNVRVAEIVGDAARPQTLASQSELLGTVDVLINSVGTNVTERAFDQLTSATWSSMLDDNLTAAFHLTKAVLPGMRERGRGLIIHVASTAARRADLSGAAYQATKAGVVALNHAVMEEEWRRGIRSTAILPGMTNTPLLDRRPAPVSDAARAAALQPEDIAATCRYVMRLPSRVHVSEIVLQPSQR